MKKKKVNKKGLMISGVILAFFLFLMIYALKQDPNFNPSQLVGETAPPISAPLAKGGEFDSNNAFRKGRWVIVNFWSSFCTVCRGEASEIETFYQTVTLKNPENPNIISINIQDDKETIAQWQSNYRQSLPVIQDLKGLISLRYGVTGTPETFFIDPKSIVRYRAAEPLNTNMILNFISWLDKNPHASQGDATKAFVKMRNNI